MKFVLTLEDIGTIIAILILVGFFIWYWITGFMIEIKTRREKKKEKKQQ